MTRRLRSGRGVTSLGEKEGERAEGPALLFDGRPFYFGIVGEVESFFRPASQAFCDEPDGRRFARSSQGHDHKVASLVGHGQDRFLFLCQGQFTGRALRH